MYNDFPILNNIEYETIKQQYSNTNQFDRKKTIFKICNEILSCKNSCQELALKYNNKIKIAVQSSFKTLNKLNDNFQSNFNLNTSENNTVKSCSLFGFIKKITDIISLILEWTRNEQKEYFKNIAMNSIKDLLNILNATIKAIDESNLILFKYM